MKSPHHLRLVPALVGAIGLLAIGCKDDGPTGGSGTSAADVSVSLTTISSPIFGESDSIPRIQCNIQLRATASGNATQQSTWDKAVYRFSLGATTPLVFSDSFPASLVGPEWGGPAINGGQTKESSWYFYASAPFLLTFDFYFHGSDGAARIASVSFNCGPKVAGTAAPTLDSLSFAPVTGPLQPGDTLSVSYKASSAVGVWLTALSITGPCRIQRQFFERLVSTQSRTLRIPLPVSCTLGTPVTVSAGVLDAGLQQAARETQTGIALADYTRPKLYVYQQSNDPIAGDFFVYDTLRLIVNATDNVSLKTIVWEFPEIGFRDSISATGTSGGEFWSRVVDPSWLPVTRMKWWARDAAGLVSDTVFSEPGRFAIHPSAIHGFRATEIGGTVRTMIRDTRRNQFYTLDADRHRVLIHRADLEPVDTILVPFFPTDMDLTASGDSLLVTLSEDRSIAIYDLTTSGHPRTILPLTVLDAAEGEAPQGIRSAANGRVFLTLASTVHYGAWRIAELDLGSTVTQTIRTDAGVGGAQTGGLVEASLDRSVLVFDAGPPGHFQAYRSASNSFGTPQTGHDSFRPSLDLTGQRVAVALDVFDGALTPIRSIQPLPNYPSNVPSVLSPDGTSIYYALARNVYRNRVSDGAFLERFTLPFTIEFMRFDPNGYELLFAHQGNDNSNIGIVDLR